MTVHRPRHGTIRPTARPSNMYNNRIDVRNDVDGQVLVCSLCFRTANHVYTSRSSRLSNISVGGAFTTASASPTCLRSVTSRRSLRRLRKIRDGDEAPAVLNCYCSGSEDDDRRFR